MNRALSSFATGILAVIIYLFIHNYNKPKAKYTIYAAGREYECNHFTISGKTIYFNDVDGDSVFINGNYTLVYEKALSQE